MGRLSSDDFKGGLIRACPEIEWTDSNDDEGVYAAFGFGILPALARLLPARIGMPSKAERPWDRGYMPSLPEPGTPEASELIERIYSFIDEGALNGDDIVQEAIVVELGEAGYGSLSSTELLSMAGSATRALMPVRTWLLAEVRQNLAPLWVNLQPSGNNLVLHLVNADGSVAWPDYATGRNDLLTILAAEQRYLVEQTGHGAVSGRTYDVKAKERLRLATEQYG